jgi:hypothetical protein
MTTLQVLAWMILLLAVANTLFLADAVRRYLEGNRHRFLLMLIVIKTVIWSIGLAVGIIAARVALGLPGLPANGLVLGWVILAIMLLPAFIWSVMRRFEA